MYKNKARIIENNPDVKILSYAVHIMKKQREHIKRMLYFLFTKITADKIHIYIEHQILDIIITKTIYTLSQLISGFQSMS